MELRNVGVPAPCETSLRAVLEYGLPWDRDPDAEVSNVRVAACALISEGPDWEFLASARRSGT